MLDCLIKIYLFRNLGPRLVTTTTRRSRVSLTTWSSCPKMCVHRRHSSRRLHDSRRLTRCVNRCTYAAVSELTASVYRCCEVAINWRAMSRRCVLFVKNLKLNVVTVLWGTCTCTLQIMMKIARN